jgi:8-oxo-dGTP pyrophosphatase MutT (NUDIX family)
MKEQVVARMLITLDEDMALLLRRCPDEEHRPGLFDLPGGEKAPDETPKRCALRETEEETGLVFKTNKVHMVWSHSSVTERRSGIMRVRRKLFLATLAIEDDVAVDLNPLEHDGYEILPVTDIPERLNHPLWSQGIREMIVRTMNGRDQAS